VTSRVFLIRLVTSLLGPATRRRAATFVLRRPTGCGTAKAHVAESSMLGDERVFSGVMHQCQERHSDRLWRMRLRIQGISSLRPLLELLRPQIDELIQSITSRFPWGFKQGILRGVAGN